MAVVLALFAIGMMIIVHEAGHYFVARWSGMRVDKFSLGFGPAILKWRHAGTQFQIAPLFFGGFVHITGMNPHEEYDERDPSVYPNRPTILRFLTIFAGPITNMLTAVVLVFAVFAIAGKEVPTGRTEVVDVTKDSAAAGVLQADDIIVKLNGEAFEIGDFVKRVQASQGAPVQLEVIREGQPKILAVTPRYDEKNQAYLLGIHIGHETRREPVGVGTAAVDSVRYPFYMSQQILSGLWDVVTRKVAADAVGPVGMTSFISDQIKAGWVRAFMYLAMLNVYLCLVNLLPLPALDGGRLVFLSYELATRRRPNPKVEAAVHVAGGVVLFILMILVTFKDIRNLFG